jgi:hypothetical protein
MEKPARASAQRPLWPDGARAHGSLPPLPILTPPAPRHCPQTLPAVPRGMINPLAEAQCGEGTWGREEGCVGWRGREGFVGSVLMWVSDLDP